MAQIQTPEAAGRYETALQAAAFHGCLTNIKVLPSVGAAPTIEGGQHESPLNASMAEEKHYYVANYLKRYLHCGLAERCRTGGVLVLGLGTTVLLAGSQS